METFTPILGGRLLEHSLEYGHGTQSSGLTVMFKLQMTANMTSDGRF